MTLLAIVVAVWLLAVLFILGWFRVGSRNERELHRIEAERMAARAEMPCPWDIAATRNASGGSQITRTKNHSQNSSRFSRAGSERPL